ncbi:sn-glycerol-3-phosphate import ATP-binding protein UgpC [Azospirillaceae bacterium]
MTVLELRRLSSVSRRRRPSSNSQPGAGHGIVQELNLAVDEGEFVALMGDEGPTVLRLIAGLEPTKGDVLIEGESVIRRPPAARDLAMVFASGALYPQMTVQENLSYGLKLRHVPRAEIDDRISLTAEFLKLEGALRERATTLTPALRQRAAIARAVVRDPAVYLLDRPLTGLSQHERSELRSMIRNLWSRLGSATLYATNDVEEAMALANRLAVLRNGAIEQIAPPLEIYRRPATLNVAKAVGFPTMNFFTIRMDNAGILVELAGGQMTALASPMSTLAERALILGIRPEHVRLVESPEPPALTLKVEWIERLGVESLVHARLPAAHGETLLIRTQEATRVQENDTIYVMFPSELIHLFDGQSGVRLGPH